MVSITVKYNKIIISIFKIVPNSGRGWDQFYLTNNNETGCSLRSKIRLDFENPEHRKGFKFQIQVCDMVSVFHRLSNIKFIGIS